MSKGLEALRRIDKHLIRHEETQEKEFNEYISIIEKELKALKIIVKKANIRLCKNNGRCYFLTTNNLYCISEEKYDLLKEVLL